jgi:hypothetical protein
MLGRAHYREWWKKAWYMKNGYSLVQNLFTTEDASCFQNHTGGVKKMVGSLIIPSLLIHYASSSHIWPSKSSGHSAASLMVMRLSRRR